MGIGIYLGGTRAFLFTRGGVPAIVRILVLIATFQLARLEPLLPPYGYVWVLTGWVAVCAVLTTRTPQRDANALLDRYLGRRAKI